MRPTILRGGIDLTHARVGGWYDAKDTWPAWLRSEGFAYDAIDAPYVSARCRLHWLERHRGGYTPQPYEQLAAVYRRAGHDEWARTVSIAKQQARRARPRKWWVRWPRRAWSLFLHWTIGYGYRRALVLPYLVGLFAVGSLVLNHADHAHPSRFTPTKAGPGQAGFNAARYTLDLLLRNGRQPQPARRLHPPRLRHLRGTCPIDCPMPGHGGSPVFQPRCLTYLATARAGLDEPPGSTQRSTNVGPIGDSGCCEPSVPQVSRRVPQDDATDRIAAPHTESLSQVAEVSRSISAPPTSQTSLVTSLLCL